MIACHFLCQNSYYQRISSPLAQTILYLKFPKSPECCVVSLARPVYGPSMC